ncbi:MAG: mechanosensitive ion channel family protein [Polyangiaceae bacterium]
MIFTAFLVNKFAPRRRPRLRRLLVLLGFHVLFFAIHRLIPDASPWALRTQVVADLLATFVYVNIGALLLFDVVLPKVGMRAATIVSDLSVGVAYIVTTVGVLRNAGMNPTEAVATGAVFSAVVALSLQSTLGNILGGVALQLDGSIEVGAWLQLENGKQGRVTRIRWRHTVLETRDWDTIIVPNASLLSSNIIVLGRRDGKSVPHRMWVHFHVDHRYSPSRVIDVVTEALHAAPIERVAEEPRPNCICLDLAHERRTSFALYAVRYYLTDLAVDDPTSSVIRTRIHSALRRAGIPLAMPATAVFVANEDDARERRRKARDQEARLAALRAVDLFDPLSNEELHTVVPHLRFAPFSVGETMTRQGAVAHWLYLMTRGEADICVTVSDGTVRTLSHLKAPAVFGEMGLMTGEPRAASVIATTDSECYRLDKNGLERILQERPEVAEELSELLAKRRVELLAMKDGLSAEQAKTRQRSEKEDILERIQSFFGIGGHNSIAP